MDFNFAEIDHLITRGLLRENQRNIFGVNLGDGGGNGQGFGYHYVYKNEQGEVIETWSSPTNVDPDDGTCDYRGGRKVYKTFENFMNRSPYKTE